jgi:hypothetical protein
MKLNLLLVATGLSFGLCSASAFGDAQCLQVEVGKWIGSAGVKQSTFEKQFCFRVGTKEYTDHTSLSDFQAGLFCKKNPKVKEGKRFLSCNGLDVFLKKRGSSDRVVALEITPLEPADL